MLDVPKTTTFSISQAISVLAGNKNVSMRLSYYGFVFGQNEQFDFGFSDNDYLDRKWMTSK